MGAIFRINIIESEDLVTTLKGLKKHKFKIMSTSLDTDESVYDVEYKKTVIVIGNEANGVSQEVLNISDKKIKIPMLRKNRKSKCSSSYRSGIIRICKTKNKIREKGVCPHFPLFNFLLKFLKFSDKFLLLYYSNYQKLLLLVHENLQKLLIRIMFGCFLLFYNLHCIHFHYVE